MRILLVTSVVLTSLVMAACGTNQTEQLSKQDPMIKQDKQLDTENQISKQTTTGMAMPESNMSESGTDISKTEEINSDAVAGTTSDNPMMKDSGIQVEVKDAMEKKSEIVMEEDKKEVANQKEGSEATTAEPKS